ncbi:hypothetical protein acsn021_07190 [Anaerocolumna cellulosilytica]|uniref:DUF4097 domain-containing protein n=1 Tax=Anaerocolumna cellulosilytica TaxID=433286 RepID=A0A6S6R1H2_9FIRM|nr:DUF4097 family beta strand repeat-containing protein [Anaerocolumna cellulosilytica]MBB5198019.1 DUF4097 and DUF4098 domain-containing protein YvlB [Anaerocolumna cellulosilytica]BCJ93150.1 hypothetical protein acsn021_07190 [Anaerocolumna cellulosilytica]
MNEFQKVIKYCAMAFAIFLTVTIIGGIAAGIISVTGAISTRTSTETIDYDENFEAVKSLYVENGVGNFTVKAGTGTTVQVVAENVSEDFTVDKNFSGELKIKSKFNFWNFLGGKNAFNNNSKITVYLPEGFEADRVKIEAGAGNVNIEELDTQRLEIEAGAGDINGLGIIAGKVSLDGGVGEITLEDVDLSDVDMDAGVGNISIEGYLRGESEINAGIGNVSLDIYGSSDDYNIKVDKGLGNVTINGQNHSSLNWNNRTAKNSLDIDGGVGNIDISFKE